MNRLPVQKKRKKSKAFKITISVIVSLIMLFILGMLIVNIWLNRNYFVVIVDGTSMNDTLSDQDRLYASYKTDAERGDIIIIDASKNQTFSPDGSERLLIKRLIAIAGDTVECKGGIVYLNGEVLAEPYLKQATPDFGEVTLGEGEIFFLGDNRSNSKDSEDIVSNGYGNHLKYEDIVGIVPQWAVRNKGPITSWEKFRKSVSDFFSVGTIHKTGG